MVTKTPLIVFIAVVTASSVSCTVMPAGKCNTYDISPITLDLDTFVKFGRWQVIYATELYKDMDNEIREANITGDKGYSVTDTRTYVNGSTEKYECTAEYINNVIYENTQDEKGNNLRFRVYPLAVTKENAILYLRCSVEGYRNMDTRIIEIPEGNTLSEKSLQQLMKADKDYKFRGTLSRLPYKRVKTDEF